MKEEEARIARTESAYRHVNERIAETAEAIDGNAADFVCECADIDCQDRVEAQLDDYEQARKRPTTFLVAEGHELPAYEHVRRRRRGYLIVEKMTRSLRGAVRRTDPRADTNLGGFGGKALVARVRWSLPGKDAGSARIRGDTGATEDADLGASSAAWRHSRFSAKPS